jgi:hypothetical protein
MVELHLDPFEPKMSPVMMQHMNPWLAFIGMLLSCVALPGGGILPGKINFGKNFVRNFGTAFLPGF